MGISVHTAEMEMATTPYYVEASRPGLNYRYSCISRRLRTGEERLSEVSVHTLQFIYLTRFLQTFYLRDGVGHDDHIWCVHISVVR